MNPPTELQTTGNEDRIEGRNRHLYYVGDINIPLSITDKTTKRISTRK